MVQKNHRCMRLSCLARCARALSLAKCFHLSGSDFCVHVLRAWNSKHTKKRNWMNQPPQNGDNTPTISKIPTNNCFYLLFEHNMNFTNFWDRHIPLHQEAGPQAISWDLQVTNHLPGSDVHVQTDNWTTFVNSEGFWPLPIVSRIQIVVHFVFLFHKLDHRPFIHQNQLDLIFHPVANHDLPPWPGCRSWLKFDKRISWAKGIYCVFVEPNSQQSPMFSKIHKITEQSNFCIQSFGNFSKIWSKKSQITTIRKTVQTHLFNKHNHVQTILVRVFKNKKCSSNSIDGTKEGKSTWRTPSNILPNKPVWIPH